MKNVYFMYNDFTLQIYPTTCYIFDTFNNYTNKFVLIQLRLNDTIKKNSNLF